MASTFASGLIIAVGTYDGVLAGWEFTKETKNNARKANVQRLTLTFAMGVHEGSIRSLCIAGNIKLDEPGALLSCGYDETLKTHDWSKRQTSSGEIRTPSGFGTPMCSAFAPPAGHSTHCVVGFSGEGKICIYKKRDWSVQHVLAGHDGGLGALAVHPSGKLALSGGLTDGKLKLWDLTKGRLSFVNRIKHISSRNGCARYNPITSIVWSEGGDFYAFSHDVHITVREVATGKALLDVELPSRVNQVALMSGSQGIFVAAACNDGSLPVLAVEDNEDESRKAIMAIESVDSHLAREERFKCIQSVREYHVVTANSAGVVSLMNLKGAINMMSESEEFDGSTPLGDDESEERNISDRSNTELAVDIIESVQLGTGARITCLAAWCKTKESQSNEDQKQNVMSQITMEKKPDIKESTNKRKLESKADKVMDAGTVKKARSLVRKAKKLKSKKEKKKMKK